MALRREMYPSNIEGLEWADQRVIDAIEEENSGRVGAYMAVVRRVILAQSRAIKKGRNAS